MILYLVIVVSGQLDIFKLSLLYKYYPTSDSSLITFKFDNNEVFYLVSFFGKDSYGEIFPYATCFTIFTDLSQGSNVMTSIIDLSPRIKYGITLLNNSIIIIGGYDDNGLLNDINHCEILIDDSGNFIKTFCNKLLSTGDTKMIPIASFAITSNGKDTIYLLGGVTIYSENYENLAVINIDLKGYTYLEYSYVECSEFELIDAEIILDPTDDQMYLFAGINYKKPETKSYFKDLCVFNLSSNTWKLHSLDNKLNNISHGASFYYSNSLYYIFGLQNGKVNKNIYKLDLDKKSLGWVTVNLSNDYNCERYSFGMSKLNDSYYLLTFGTDSFNLKESTAFLKIIDSNNFKISCDFDMPVPNPRYGASLTQISDRIILFGGKNNNKLYNDLWIKYYSYIESEVSNNNVDKFWRLASCTGAVPSPRYEHAVASQGNFMLIFGGIDASEELLSDFWILDTSNRNYKWKKIEPLINDKTPQPLTGTCVLLNFPYFYVIGGRDSKSYLSDIWIYEFNANKFIEHYDNILYDPLAYHACHFNKTENSVYTFYGSNSHIQNPVDYIQRINLENLSSMEINNIGSGKSKFASAVINNNLITFGGLMDNIQISGKISIVNLNSYNLNIISPSDKFDLENYYSSYSYIGKYFYVLSGKKWQSNNIKQETSPNSIVFQAFNFDLEEIIECSPGYYLDMLDSGEKDCKECPEGTYKSIYNISCINCDPGTYNENIAATDPTQCLPCGFGTYSNSSGSSSCYECEVKENCFAGFKSDDTGSIKLTDTQPKILHFNNMWGFIRILIPSICGFAAIYIITWVFSLKFKTFLSVMDLFKNKHLDKPKLENDEEISNLSTPKYSLLGGFFTGLLFILIISISVYYTYLAIEFDSNESVTLVPTNFIKRIETAEFENLKIYIGSSSMFGCNDINMNISVSGNIKYDNETDDENEFGDANSSNIFLKSFEIEKSNGLITSRDFIDINISCIKCFTSDIIIAVESDAAYHDQISRSVSILNITDGNVLVGTTPSIFKFNLVPCYYEDITKDPEMVYYGYRVSNSDSPSLGSTSSLSSYFFSKDINVKILFSIDSFGVVTSRSTKLGAFSILGVAAGTISGAIGVFAILIKAFEFIYYKYTFRNKRIVNEYENELESRRLFKKKGRHRGRSAVSSEDIN